MKSSGFALEDGRTCWQERRRICDADSIDACVGCGFVHEGHQLVIGGVPPSEACR
ncbi:hypothetical protein [Candidatus Poriferisodalis sp.]|uniref:hypothetical protein n=1 Tax=Candidatus Poriferisodalis sp. TaxID=3101277 RepID=UPI003B01DBF3